MRFAIIPLLLFYLICNRPLPAQAQKDVYNFRHLGASSGLSDGVVRAIGQDKYGYIWVGTLSGLNRFDGYSVRSFYNDPKDSFSLPPSPVRSLLCDQQGQLWVGCSRRLVRYDYATSRFLPVAGSKDFGVYKMLQHRSGIIYLSTSQGLQAFDPVTQKRSLLANPKDSTLKALAQLRDIFLDNDLLYAATNEGIVVYNVVSKKAYKRVLSFPGVEVINSLVKDRYNNIWFMFNNNAILGRTDTAFRFFTTYPDFEMSEHGFAEGRVFLLYVDHKKELWLSTHFNGLARFDYKREQFIQYHNDPLRQTSLIANQLTQLFEDRKGYIWIGTEGNGVDYFHPDKNFIRMFPLPEKIVQEFPSLWGRNCVIDKDQNYWLSFANGLMKMSPDRTRFTLFRNMQGSPPQLHYNSVRSLYLDADDDLWIGTADGMNRYHLKTGQMDFFDEKDSLPKGFFWQITQDSRKNMWFAEAFNIYYKMANDPQIHSIGHHPFLSRLNNLGCRIIFEDHKKRLWFGMNGFGLVMFDPSNNQVKEWKRTEESDTTLTNNLISSIAEDQNGVLWLATFTGLTSFNPATNIFHRYTQENGLPSLKLSGLLVDRRNRLWIGSTKGLLVLDSSRKNFKTFDQQDGLPTMEFSDMDAYKLADGSFIYPTMKGFIQFNPEDYNEDVRQVEVYLSSARVSGKKLLPGNAEELTNLELSYDQNSFSVQLTAFNYSNPEQTWYAYQLEGFDKDWIYTKDRQVNYTNVPGGEYTFRYKATSDPNNWNVPQKVLAISIGTIFYKTAWFWVLFVASLGLLLFVLYKNRMLQQRRIFTLQTKAQALEKEKAMVMYESLKQQLNPHFLFNSLTSLGSLIKVDQKLASQFLDGMSKTYRYILKSRDAELVRLEEEVEFVQHYIRLQQTRFETGFEVKFNIREEDLDKKI
ncbi:MAG TPA: two-component regulator propeller domain-containing protein, partial [Flavisolibacter sp.]|nr:two-component regulator propeller domain-containing protein [Flavisolibacter sp.]